MTEPYICITAHFITAAWTLNAVCLSVQFFPVRHTSETIASYLVEVLQEYSKKGGVAVTTDNAANCIKATKTMKVNGDVAVCC